MKGKEVMEEIKILLAQSYPVGWRDALDTAIGKLEYEKEVKNAELTLPEIVSILKELKAM